MAVKAQRFGGEHTHVKLDILRNYLSFYTQALSRKFSLIYIDPFCGSGFYGTRDEQVEDQQLHLGSALTALDIPRHRFDRLILNDIKKSNVEALIDVVNMEFPDRSVEFHTRDANEFIRMFCDAQSAGGGWRSERGVIFLDPFATEVSWDSIKAIASTESLDMWMLFPRKALSRVTPISVQDDLHDHPFRNTLNRVFGDDSWHKLYDDAFKRIFNQKVSVDRAWQPMLGTLADIDVNRAIRGTEAMIVYLYRMRLKSVLPWVSEKRAALYIQGQPHFELMFAASNPSPRAGTLATRVADYILEKHPSVQIKD